MRRLGCVFLAVIVAAALLQISPSHAQDTQNVTKISDPHLPEALITNSPGRKLQRTANQPIIAELEFPQDYTGGDIDQFRWDAQRLLQTIACPGGNQITVLNVQQNPTVVKLQINPATEGPSPRLMYNRISSVLQSDNTPFLNLLQSAPQPATYTSNKNYYPTSSLGADNCEGNSSVQRCSTARSIRNDTTDNSSAIDTQINSDSESYSPLIVVTAVLQPSEHVSSAPGSTTALKDSTQSVAQTTGISLGEPYLVPSFVSSSGTFSPGTATSSGLVDDLYDQTRHELLQNGYPQNVQQNYQRTATNVPQTPSGMPQQLLNTMSQGPAHVGMQGQTRDAAQRTIPGTSQQQYSGLQPLPNIAFNEPVYDGSQGQTLGSFDGYAYGLSQGATGSALGIQARGAPHDQTSSAYHESSPYSGSRAGLIPTSQRDPFELSREVPYSDADISIQGLRDTAPYLPKNDAKPYSPQIPQQPVSNGIGTSAVGSDTGAGVQQTAMSGTLSRPHHSFSLGDNNADSRFALPQENKGTVASRQRHDSVLTPNGTFGTQAAVMNAPSEPLSARDILPLLTSHSQSNGQGPAGFGPSSNVFPLSGYSSMDNGGSAVSTGTSARNDIQNIIPSLASTLWRTGGYTSQRDPILSQANNDDGFGGVPSVAASDGYRGTRMYNDPHGYVSGSSLGVLAALIGEPNEDVLQHQQQLIGMSNPLQRNEPLVWMSGGSPAASRDSVTHLFRTGAGNGGRGNGIGDNNQAPQIRTVAPSALPLGADASSGLSNNLGTSDHSHSNPTEYNTAQQSRGAPSSSEQDSPFSSDFSSMIDHQDRLAVPNSPSPANAVAVSTVGPTSVSTPSPRYGNIAATYPSPSNYDMNHELSTASHHMNSSSTTNDHDAQSSSNSNCDAGTRAAPLDTSATPQSPTSSSAGAVNPSATSREAAANSSSEQPLPPSTSTTSGPVSPSPPPSVAPAAAGSSPLNSTASSSSSSVAPAAAGATPSPLGTTTSSSSTSAPRASNSTAPGAGASGLSSSTSSQNPSGSLSSASSPNSSGNDPLSTFLSALGQNMSPLGGDNSNPIMSWLQGFPILRDHVMQFLRGLPNVPETYDDEEINLAEAIRSKGTEWMRRAGSSSPALTSASFPALRSPPKWEV